LSRNCLVARVSQRSGATKARFIAGLRYPIALLLTRSFSPT